MRSTLVAGAVLAVAISGTVADLCSLGSQDVGGNWYCHAVNSVSYTGIDGSGSYQKVMSMDDTTGNCTQQEQGYSGLMSPMNEEVSLHFRGPVGLKKFAAYSSGSSTQKKHKRTIAHRHGHDRFHKRQEQVRAAQEAIEKRAECEMVTATIDGAAVSWMNDYMCTPATSAAAAVAEATSSSASTTSAPAAAPAAATSTVDAAGFIGNAPTSSSSSAASEPSDTGSWGQVAYYDSESQTATGLTFLNHMGGTTGASGVWSSSFGNSLSYAGSDGVCGATSPQVLADVQIPSTGEIVIMSDKECANGDCGYTRDGATAHHGFGGHEKAFFFQFNMPQVPEDDASGGNMPAIWMLNSQIPNTLQYGNPNCSCWTTGCGEFDIFEVLASGDYRAKSTLHGNAYFSGGDSDFFTRPNDTVINVGVVMYDGNIHIQVMDDFGFSGSLASHEVNDICTKTLAKNDDTSVFAVAQR